MKRITCLFLVVTALCLGAFAQGAPPPPAPSGPLQNIYAAGISYNNSVSPSVAGTALYAHSLNDATGTYAFTVMDALPTTFHPFNVTTNVGAGIAQKLFSIGSVPVYVPTSAGVSFSGTNTGFQWSSGAMASIHVKGSWYAFPNLRFVHSNVSNGSGYQITTGFMFGWGK